MSVHEGRAAREARFTSAVERIVRRGGRCLIPVFALGRAQELLLILEELWAAKPELRSIPIYHASDIADRALDTYRTYIGAMNAKVQRAVSGVGAHNPWNFRYIRSIRRGDFKDVGPCVVLAAPGMLQKGFSRDLFDKWAEDPRNGVILAGYSVEGTLARTLEAQPTEVDSLSLRKLTRRCLIERISFSAHADSAQTHEFIEKLKPDAIVLVHGERNEMRRLFKSLADRYAGSERFRGVTMPANNQSIAFEFNETKVVRIMGSLAESLAGVTGGGGVRLPRAIFVERHFDSFLVAQSDLPRFSQLTSVSLGQTLHVPFRCSFGLLEDFVRAMFSDATDAPEAADLAPPGRDGRPARSGLSVAGGLVHVTHAPPDRAILRWNAGPQADLIADALVTVLAQVGVSRTAIAKTTRICAHGRHAHSGGSSNAMETDEAGAAAGGGDDDVVKPAKCAHSDVYILAGGDEARSGAGGGGDAPSLDGDDSSWAAREPWAAALLASDSGPCASDGSNRAALRRAATLIDLFSDQFGSENVSLVEDRGGSGEGFALRVTCDGVVARVDWDAPAEPGSAGKIRVSSEGGGGAAGTEEKTHRWLSALATTASLVDELALPAVGAPAATIQVVTS